MPTGVSRRYRVSYGVGGVQMTPRMSGGRYARARAEELTREHGTATLWRRFGGQWVTDATYQLMPSGRIRVQRDDSGTEVAS